MSLFAIADLHLSLGTDKPMDIFGGWSDYVTKLETNWQNKVRPEDTVVIPGDISWGMSLEQSRMDFEFLNKLNGRKIISITIIGGTPRTKWINFSQKTVLIP